LHQLETDGDNNTQNCIAQAKQLGWKQVVLLVPPEFAFLLYGLFVRRTGKHSIFNRVEVFKYVRSLPLVLSSTAPKFLLGEQRSHPQRSVLAFSVKNEPASIKQLITSRAKRGNKHSESTWIWKGAPRRPFRYIRRFMNDIFHRLATLPRSIAE